MRKITLLFFALLCASVSFATGWFSVSADKQVEFASGNLQYHTGDKVFRFAPHQYDTIGEANINIGDASFKGWIDMFAWSTTSTYLGVSASNKNEDYTGDFHDWGQIFPGDRWYTLSETEWTYVAKQRPNANKLWALAEVDGIFGYLLLPDDWQKPADVPFAPAEKPTEATGWELVTNIYNLTQWGKLEESGAAFFPAAGRRTGGYGNLINYNQVEETNPSKLNKGYYRWQSNTNELCYYWTSTMHNTTTRTICYMLNEVALGNDEYDYAGFGPGWYEKGRYGQSVRLARERDIPAAEKPYGSKLFSVGANKQILFGTGNLQYHTGDKTWRLAPHQYDIVGADNINIGDPSYKGWLDMFAWSTTSTYYGVNPSNKNDDYTGDFVDWGNLFPGARAYTLSKEEWEYLLNTRPNAKQKIGQGMVGNVSGTIILPDDWTDVPGITFVPGELPEQSYDNDDEDYIYQPYGDVYYHSTKNNVYSLQDWAKLEEAGAVFLPNAGRRAGGYGNYTNYNQQTVANMYRWQDNMNTHSYYWTSSICNPETKSIYYMMNLRALGGDKYTWDQLLPWAEKGRYGQSVRLAFLPVQVGDTIRYAYEGNNLFYVITANSGTNFTAKAVNAGGQYPNYYPNEADKPTGKLVIPDSIQDVFGVKYAVTRLERSAFDGCQGITEAVINDNVSSWGDCVFRFCSSLAKVTLSKNLTTLPQNVFVDCPLTALDLTYIQSVDLSVLYNAAIPTLHIPAGLTQIHNQSCLFLSLSSLTIDEANPAFCIVDGLLYNKDTTLLVGVPGKMTGKVTVPATAATFYYRVLDGTMVDLVLPHTTVPAFTWTDDREKGSGKRFVPCGMSAQYAVDESWKIYFGNFVDTLIYTATLKAEHGSIAKEEVAGECSQIKLTATPDPNYVFDHWTDDATAEATRTVTLNRDSTFTAVFKLVQYTITWKVRGETVLEMPLPYGTPIASPVAIGYEYVQTDSIYTLTGWTPELAPTVTKDETYTAVLSVRAHKYLIRFLDDDNSPLCSDEWDYGQTPTCDDPQKPEDEQYTYTFAGWDKPIAQVTGEATYKATYTATEKHPSGIYSVTDGQSAATKFFRNGTLYILRDGKIYTAAGVEMK